MKLKGNFELEVPEGVTETQVNEAVLNVLHGLKKPGTIVEVYVGGSDDQPPHP